MSSPYFESNEPIFKRMLFIRSFLQEVTYNISNDFNGHDNNVGFLLVSNVVGLQFMKLIWIFNPLIKIQV